MNKSHEMVRKAFEQPRWYVTKWAFNIRLRVEAIHEFLHPRKPESVLDIGCGDGSLSLHYLNSGSRVTLLDRSRAMLNLAGSRIPEPSIPNVTVVNSDLMAADLPKAGYDLIICVGVMAYIDDDLAFLEKVVSHLKPGGSLIIECSDGGHFVTWINRGYERLRVLLGGAQVPTSVRPAAHLIKLLAELGLERRGAFRYSLPLPGIRKLLSQNACYWAIRRKFGTASQNCNAWLGNECLFHFQRVPQ